jgi:hypothetical protein
VVRFKFFGKKGSSENRFLSKVVGAGVPISVVAAGGQVTFLGQAGQDDGTRAHLIVALARSLA